MTALRKWLPSWSQLGLLVLLGAPWLVPTNKLYHQLIIFLLWLPGLLMFGYKDLRRLLVQKEVLLFALFVAWTLLVLAVEGGSDPTREVKIVMYVTLTLSGILLAAQHPKLQLETLLSWASGFGGVLALLSWIYFYLIQSHPYVDRILPLGGVWDTIIMAAHAVGSLGLLGVFLCRPGGATVWMKVLLAIAAIGYLLFLGASQTRGVWIALGVTLVVMSLTLNFRKGGLLVLAVLVVVAAVAVLAPDILEQRGMSLRPPLWESGLALIGQHWPLGLGFHQYLIQIPGTDLFYKHPHNLFLDTGVREGALGLGLFLLLWGCVGWRAWSCRAQPLGRALLAVWVFSSTSLMTDGIGLWFKPNADWLITWLPVGLSLVLASRMRAPEAKTATVSS